MPYSDLYCLKCGNRMQLQYEGEKPKLWVCHTCKRTRRYITRLERLVEILLAMILVIGGSAFLVIKLLFGIE